MKRLWDKLLLMVLISLMVFQKEGAEKPVVVFLIGIIAVALGAYLQDRRYVAIACALYLISAFFIPEIILFLPVILTTAWSYRFYWCAVGIIPFGVLAQHMEFFEIILWLTLCGIGILLTMRGDALDKMQADMNCMRDTDAELTMILREKNKGLMEKQDYEIYLATLRERNRIAREIHDNVGHMLSRSILQIGALKAIYKEDTIQSQLTSINDTLNSAMNSIRESVHDLHDDSIDLHQAVMEATKDMQNDYHVTVDYDMSRTVPRNVKYCLIAIVKEAMANVVKHSNGDKVSIILREHPAFYQLLVEDNGKNTEKDASYLNGDGIGLSNMRERVNALNGTLSITNGDGFKLFITIRKDEEKGE